MTATTVVDRISATAGTPVAASLLRQPEPQGVDSRKICISACLHPTCSQGQSVREPAELPSLLAVLILVNDADKAPVTRLWAVSPHGVPHIHFNRWKFSRRPCLKLVPASYLTLLT